MSENIFGKNNLPLVLAILDGWGLDKSGEGNAISHAKTPAMKSFWEEYPHVRLCAAGACVGLPDKQAGNSEAGHMNIGAGRIVDQDVVRINRAIKDGTFFKNTAFLEALRRVKEKKSNIHLMGMLSAGTSPHSDTSHLLALLKFLREAKVKKFYLHLFTDGRDSPKYSSLKLVEALERELRPGEYIATIMGRFYAMDRKKKWERIEASFNALVMGRGRTAKSPQAAITEGYNRGESDEFIEPYVITDQKGKAFPRISDNDSLIFFNLRSDRARQLAKPFVQKDFNKKNPGAFKRAKVLKDLHFVAMTDFGPDLDGILTAYPSVDLPNTLPIALKELRQLYITESEKYAHITYFFNGGYADVVNGEKREVFSSPDVKYYSQTPAMSADKISARVVSCLERNEYDFIALNFSAPDMIGHTGDLTAAIKCCEQIDVFLDKVVKACLKAGGTVIITADHGNIEKMINPETGEVFTEHTANAVPFILVNKNLRDKVKLKNKGVLGDIAPTIIDLLGLKKPKEMSGDSLIIKK